MKKKYEKREVLLSPGDRAIINYISLALKKIVIAAGAAREKKKGLEAVKQ